MGLHLITGGNGFVGRVLAKHLLNIGEQVRIIDICENNSPDLDKCEYISADIMNTNELKKSLKNVDYVHHLAVAVPLLKNSKTFWRTNFQGTRIVYRSAMESGAKHFCFMSSSSVWGRVTLKDCPLPASPETRPFEQYGRSKAAAEKYIMNCYKKAPQMTTSIIRPRTIIGPGRLGIFSILFDWVNSNRKIFIIGDGSNLFQFAHVDDVAEVSARLALKRKEGFFNVGTDQFNTLRKDLEEFCRISGSKSTIVGIAPWIAIPTLWLLETTHLSPLSSWHYRTYNNHVFCDISRTRQELGWNPRYSNIEMLCEAYNWYLQNHVNLNSKENSSSPHQSLLRQGVLSLLKTIAR